MSLIFLSFCLISLLSSVFAYKQELILIDSAGGKVSTFYDHVPDISEIPGLENVNRVCVKGIWTFYGGPNYTFGYYVKGSGGPASICEDKRFAFKSFRYGGADDTETEALTLYTSHLPYQGPQIYIEESPFAGINVPIKSLSSTGLSPWTLFEGSNFDGKSYCWAGAVNSLAGYNFKVLDKLATVGSVVKGCPKGGYKVEEFIRVKLREFWHQAQLREKNRIASENNQKKNHNNNSFENGKVGSNSNSNSNSNVVQQRPISLATDKPVPILAPVPFPVPVPVLAPERVPILVESPIVNVHLSVPVTTESELDFEQDLEVVTETKAPLISNSISNSNSNIGAIGESIRDIQPAPRPAFICYFISCKAKNIII